MRTSFFSGKILKGYRGVCMTRKERAMLQKMQVRTVHTCTENKKSMYFIGAILLLFMTMVASAILNGKIALSFLGVMLLGYMVAKLLFSLSYKTYLGSKQYNANLEYVTIDVVIPFYNEALSVIQKQIVSFQKQTFQNFHLHYIDDGSDDLEVYHYLQQIAEVYGKLSVIRTEENGGKRNAQCMVFPHLQGDFVFTTDSDTTFHEKNLWQLLQPFENEDILATTGHVRVLNESETWLSQLLSIRYFNAFEVERAGQSALGSVLVCSGPNTLFRRTVIQKHIGEYKNQMFLGKKQTYGDDRALTNFVLRDGLAVYQSNAQCFTEVPARLNKFLRQQIRWSKSFFRESYLGLNNAWKYKRMIPFLWILIELLLFPLFLMSLMYVGYLIVSGQFTWFNFIVLLLFTIINAYIRNIYFVNIDKQIFILAPLYSFIHLFLLTPIRLWALLTLRDTKWGTRELVRKGRIR